MKDSRFVRTALLSAPAALLAAASAFADTTPQALPFSQNWTNIGLITTNNDWSGVPGIAGYASDLSGSTTNVDPQTLLADQTTLFVLANQTNPNISNGGVAEFHIANPVVALQGSAAADAPNLVITVNCTGASSIHFSCRLRDIDGSGDNTNQQVAVQYRVGNTGSFLNIPAGYIADATSGPNLATQKTVIVVTLPAPANGQPIVQIRVITSNAPSSDEWVGVDDIYVTNGLVDSDFDGIPNFTDNCPSNSNANQSDCDDNGIGDACDSPCPGDQDNDGVADPDDNCPTNFNPGQEDCDNNGIGDVCEAQPDCNLNGIPDNCEPDCNTNLIADSCDIALMISQDCNGNGIPDECEADCNGNLIPDDCDINIADPDGDGLVSPDVNANGIPDECENGISVLINEILADPPGANPGDLAGDANGDGIRDQDQDEFVEIVNSTAGPVDISGWTLSDAITVRHTFPVGTVLQSQCGIVVFGGGSPQGQFGGMVVQTASSGILSLNNAGDTVTLRDASNLYVNIITYGSAGGDNQSLTRNPDLGRLPLVKHSTIPPGANFSPGRKVDLSTFSGCSALPDADNDGIPDVTDNCPFIANSSQADCDADGIGNACDADPDTNGNGVPDTCEVTPNASLKLNEIRIDEPSNDCNEYIEIKGNAGVSLNNLAVVVIGDGTGGSGVIEHVYNLSGVMPADGHYLIASPVFTLSGGVNLVTGNSSCTNGGLGLENSDNLTFVLVANFTGFTGEDLDTESSATGGDGVLNITPWLHVADAVSLVETPNPQTVAGNEWNYAVSLGGADVGPDANLVPGHVYRCQPGGTWTIGAFDPFGVGADDTPGTANTLNPCAAPCQADIAPQPNGDGLVNIQDLTAVILQWGNPGGTADVNHDGIVNIQDLTIIILAWGACP